MINIKLIDTFPIAFFIIIDEKIVECNLSALSMFGYKNKSDLVGKTFSQLSPPYQLNGVVSLGRNKQLLRDAYFNKYTTFEWLFKKKSGESFLTYVNFICINNKTYAIITNTEEIDEFSYSLSNEENIYHFIFEDNKCVMFLVDPLNGNIVYGNKTALNFYGYTLEDFKKINIMEINVNNEDDVKSCIDNAMNQKQNYFIFKHKVANNEVHDVETYSIPIKINGKDYLFNQVFDISENFKSFQIYNNLFLNSPNAIAVLDTNGNVVNVNNKFMSMFLYTKEEIINKPIKDLIILEDLNDEITSNLKTVYNGNVISSKTIRKRKDNQIIHVEIFATPIIFNNSIVGVYVSYQDITDKHQYEKQLELLKRVLENNNEGICITNTDALIEWINPMFTNITGYTFEEVKGKNPSILQSKLHNREFYKSMWDELLDNGRWSGEIWNKNKAGDIYPEWLNIFTIKNTNNVTTHYVGIFKDLSEMKIIDNKMRILAQKDALTGLYNRYYFLEKLNNVIKEMSKNEGTFALLFMDLNNFKDINDSLGHHVGDQMLIKVASLLLNNLPMNSIISRYGGDEFVVLLKNVKTKQQVNKIINRIFTLLSEPIQVDNNLFFVSLSVGTSIYPKDGLDSESLINNADIAMYHSKDSFENKINYFNKKMKIEVEKKFYYSNLIKKAIKENNFTVMYQPVYSINTNNIEYIETNICCLESDLKKLSIDELMKLAFQTGELYNLSLLIYKVILQDLNLLKENQLFYPIAFYTSIKLLEDIKYLNFIKEELKNKVITTQDFIIKINSSNYKQNDLKVLQNVKELKSLEFKNLIDDFNNQKISISQLSQYNIDYIKLDKSFVNDIKLQNTKYFIAKAILEMCKHINILTIIDGVKDDTKLDILKELGFNYIQGLTKTVNINDFIKLLKKNASQ